ncbi:MAG TPA: cytochrome c peroxidase [Polyangiaceae bacterium LLY-WYZ-15_(1-7)]|nr:hypothetical protein [Myxococcales bacterium]MAT28951.1 hypothetical protein [Sandaracinus sp.]HJK95273.1 cytochrome c peroxidase [Polyangiaceae bacterium LLY-WYZ-15_(1-7)]MBJ72939.1 hypothetical protein [Sandaracinus sp.]HJL03509.1 cytochrome c peroxidase [Polyangiaceae bacterium LLY-WYZ-15_(1-7)]
MRLVLFGMAALLALGCGDQGFGTVGDGFVSDAGVGEPPTGDLPEDFEAARLRLGQALFFERELSGNRDTSCASCHVPFLTTTEPLPLAVGQGAAGVGPSRRRAEGAIQPRNTTDLFNRDDPASAALFWDGRVERLRDGTLVAPVALPPGLNTPLEAQALLPILDRGEMRGQPGDVAVDGRPNELAALPDDDPAAVWAAVLDRLLAIPEYVELLHRAFPDEPLGPALVARALAHFQRELWEVRDSRFDAFEAEGDPGLLTPDEHAGRALFFGDAGCARCHSGPLLSDQRFHNLAVPQLGPGKDPETGLDEGRFLVTGEPADRFRFRTPSLRNVALTPPYMHDGAYATLEAAVRHHLDPESALRAYDGAHLPASLRDTLHADPATLDALLATLDDPRPLRPLTDAEVAQLLAFLGTLTAEIEVVKGPGHGVPARVPSGLPVDVWPGGPHPHR